MTIHHATIKRAEQNGVILTEGSFNDATHSFRAHWPQQNREIFGTVAKDVLDDMIAMKTLVTEYPGLKAVQGSDGGWVVKVGGEIVGEPMSRLRDAMAEALDYCQENEIDPEEDEIEEEAPEEEDEYRGSVVAAKYRVEYKARGNANHCSDWLAGFLDGKFRRLVPGEGAGDEFDADAFVAFMRENGAEPSEKMLAMGESRARGWQGRFRMCGRQKVEKKVAETGVVKLGGTTYPVPAEALDKLHEKHPDAYTTYDENRQKAERGR